MPDRHHVFPDLSLDQAAFEALPTEALIEHIVSTHHDYIWARLPFLIPMAAKLVRVCGQQADACACLAARVSELRTVLLDHLEREEQQLTTLLHHRDADSVQQQLEEMHAAHLVVAALLRRVCEAAGLDQQPRPKACPTERALYAELGRINHHIRAQVALEERVLAPRLAAAARL